MLPTNILMVKETPMNEYDDYIDNVNIIVNCILGDYNIIVFDRDPADITNIIVNEDNTSNINIKCGATEDTRFVSMRGVGDNLLYISITHTKNILTIMASYHVDDERIKNFNLWMDYVIGNTNKDSNFKNVIINGYDFNNTDIHCDDYGSSVELMVDETREVILYNSHYYVMTDALKDILNKDGDTYYMTAYPLQNLQTNNPFIDSNNHDNIKILIDRIVYCLSSIHLYNAALILFGKQGFLSELVTSSGVISDIQLVSKVNPAVVITHASTQGYIHLLSAFTKKELREIIFKIQPYLDENMYTSCTRSRLLKHMTGLLEFDSNKQKIINIVNDHSNK